LRLGPFSTKIFFTLAMENSSPLSACSNASDYFLLRPGGDGGAGFKPAPTSEFR
jgi:hypothetical protein